MALGSAGCPCTDHRSPAIDLQVNIESRFSFVPVFNKKKFLPGCQQGMHSRSVQGWCGCTTQRCKVQPGLLTPGGEGVNTWLDRVRNLWGWVDGESKLGFLPVVNGQSLEKQGCKTGPSATSEGVEDQETLEF